MGADTDLCEGGSSGQRKNKWNTVTGPPPMDPNKLYLNPGEEDQMELQGYVRSQLHTTFTYIFIILTGGLLRLVFHWMPQWFLRSTHRAASLAEATSVLLKDQYEQMFVAQIQTITKDGTRVAVLKPSATMALSARTRRKHSQLFLNSGQQDESLIRYFMVKKVKYIWDPVEDRYMKLRGLEFNNTCSYFHEAKGLSYSHQLKRRVLYGVNSIAVHVSPIIVLLYKEALSPFYIFQLFSCTIWYIDEYMYYASCIILISLISITTSIYQTRKMQRALRNTISTTTVVSVCRGGDNYEDIPSEDLVPGDVIEIPQYGCVMQCDAVLISGNCIVNESMLTGESVPVTKTPLQDEHEGHPSPIFNMKDHAKHTLFCGTHIIQTRYYGHHRVRAVVLRTGFLTSKGELVRAILYPKPVDFKFNKDTYYFVGVLASIAAVGLVYTIVLKVGRGDSAFDIIKRSLDLFTIAVPPALPAALTVGIVFAQNRMKRSGIYCISPRSINICGSVNAVCFDKTGTLTEDGLNMQGVVPVYNNQFHEEITNMLILERGHIMETMATCHSLTIIDGKLCGDPLDLLMFESINWNLEEAGDEESSRFDMLKPTIVYPKHSTEMTMTAEELSAMDNDGYSKEDRSSESMKDHPGDQIGIIRQFTFTSSLQRMSVITRRIGAQKFELFCKGAPEMVVSLCKPETVPVDFHDVLMSYTQHGYRVLGMAYKELPAKYNYVKVQRVPRETMEQELNFLGLLVMENKLKLETTPVIEQLNEANIRTVMVTGDNILTALSVARECRMVARGDKILLVEATLGHGELGLPKVEFLTEDRVITATSSEMDICSSKEFSMTKIEIEESVGKYHLALTGKSWDVLRQHFPQILSKVLVRGVVFARMSPEQKAQLVECLQELGYYVAMCGDGANDCGALKMAHAGISLSEAEASVASPFTSKQPNIECVPTVIREGRAALVTSFGIFKYMACYSLTQFVSVLLLYKISGNLTDFEFLYIDLFLLTSLSVTYGHTEAYPSLVKEPPQLRLFNLAPILSLLLQMIIQIAAQVFVFFHIKTQPWYEKHNPADDEDFVSFENTAIFSVSVFQYVVLAVAFSKGHPYRKSIFTNYIFLANLVLCMAMNCWLTIYPLDFLVDLFELMPSPSVTYRLIFFGIACINCLLSVILETFLLDHEGLRLKFNNLRERCFPSFKYEYRVIQDELNATPTWPHSESFTVATDTNVQTNIPDEFSSETDKMLPLSEVIDMNNSALKTSVTVEITPKSSVIEEGSGDAIS